MRLLAVKMDWHCEQIDEAVKAGNRSAEESHRKAIDECFEKMEELAR